MKNVEITYRDCKIMYEVDMNSISTMANHYGIDWEDMKKALRQYGFTIRKNEPKPAEPVKDYTVTLVDTAKIVVTPVAPVTAE